jgi:hypothetical protein
VCCFCGYDEMACPDCGECHCGAARCGKSSDVIPGEFYSIPGHLTQVEFMALNWSHKRGVQFRARKLEGVPEGISLHECVHHRTSGDAHTYSELRGWHIPGENPYTFIWAQRFAPGSF